MTEKDRTHWDDRYRTIGSADSADPPPRFAPHADLFPTAGCALELACGRGRTAVWLAARGLDVWAVDVSPVAVQMARDLAAATGLRERCRFDVVDLDGGLPEGPPVDVLVCHLFRDVRLYPAMVERLAPGGLLAVAVLSEVDAEPGPYRAVTGELGAAFAGLEVLTAGERSGEAWLLARR